MCLTILVFLINVFMVLVMGIIDHVPAALDVLAAVLGSARPPSFSAWPRKCLNLTLNNIK